MNVFRQTLRWILPTFFIALTASLAVPLTARAQTIIYVNQNVIGSSQSGTSWANAYSVLTTALSAAAGTAAANNPVQLWVAAGTYKPSGGTDRTQSFRIPSYVTIIGGFAGTESNPSQRPASGYYTVLSGDIGNIDPDGVTSANVGAMLAGTTPFPSINSLLNNPYFADNSYNVVTCEGVNNVALNTLIITGGNANDLDANGNLIISLTNLDGMITPDYTTEANGNLIGDPQVAPAPVVDGGGIFVTNYFGRATNTKTLTLVNCVLVHNAAAYMGGGIAAFEANLNFSGCQFIANSSQQQGGAGGGLNDYYAISNCTFSNNAAYYFGGALDFATLPSSKTVSSAGGIEQAEAQAQAVGASLKLMFSASKFAFSKLTGGPSIWAEIDSASLINSDPENVGLYDSTAVAEDAAFGVGDVYSVVGIAMSAGSLLGDMAVALGANPNSSAYQGWLKTSDFFSTYLSPVGLLTQISDAFGGDLGNLSHQPSFEDEQYEYMTNELSSYNVAPYSTVSGCTFQANAAQGEGGAIVAHYDNIEISDCWFLTNSAVGPAGAVGLMGWNTPRVFNCAFSGNTSINGYSAVYNDFHARTQIINDTLVGNTSTSTNGPGTGACVGSELGSAVKIYNSVLWGNIDAENPAGGADLFVATSQNIDSGTYSAYSQAGVGQSDYIATLDLRASTVQSFNSLPVGTEEYELYPWNADSYVISVSDQAFDYADEYGFADLAGYVNQGEGIRPTDFDTFENQNYQYVNVWGNNANFPELTGRAGVVPLPTSPLLINSGNISSFSLWSFNSDFTGPLPIFSSGDYFENGNDVDGFANVPETEDAVQNNSLTDIFGVTTTQGADTGCVQYQGNNQQGLAGTTFYVRAGAPANGDGTSWATAYPNFNYVMGNSDSRGLPGGVSVWIAQGSYTLPANANLSGGILLYGGFAGTETSLSQRNWAAYPTAISGTLSCFGSALLDGLTMTNYGNQNSFPTIIDDNGGDTFSGDQLNINNCYFANDYEPIYWDGYLVISNSQFVGNFAISNNYGYNMGGAVYGSEVTAMNCWFENNTASGDGGAIAFYDYIEAMDCVFTGNTAPAGSAISGISANTADYPGAWHLYNDTFFGNGIDTLNIVDSYLPGSPADDITGPVPTPVNCLFWGNLSDGLPPQPNDPLFLDPAALDFQLSPDSPYIGGGTTNGLPGNFPTTDLAGNPRLINGRLDPGAFEYQGASGYQSQAALSGTNQILSVLTNGNTTPTSLQWQIYSNDVWVNIANGSVYQGVNSLQLTISPTLAMYGYQYRLVGVVSGSTTDFTPVELVNPAPSDIVYVNQKATGTGDGTSWQNAFTSLTNVFGDAYTTNLIEVWVARGAYTTPDTIVNGAITIYGGFNGTETGVNERNLSNNPTLFTGYTAAPLMSDTMDFRGATYIDGVIFSNYNGNPYGPIYDDNNFSTPTGTFVNCTFINISNTYSGAIDWQVGTLNLSNCQFVASQTPTGGGALQVYDLNAVNCSFENNASGFDGGAIFFLDTATVIDCAFIGNSCFAAPGEDGYIGTGSAIYRNPTYPQASPPTSTTWQLYNDTFYGNNQQAVVDGNSVYVPSTTVPTANCLFWQNATDNVPAQAYPGLSSDPLFVAPAAGDFELTSSSPAIGSGETTNLPALFPATDLAGNPRLSNGRLDAGAYQFQGTPLTPPAYAITNSAAYYVNNLFGPNYTITVDVGTSGTPSGLQWQVNTGNGIWTNLVNGTLYQGVNTLQLTVLNPPPAAANDLYRLTGVAANSAYFELAATTVPWVNPAYAYATSQTDSGGFNQSGQWGSVYNLSAPLGSAAAGASLQWQVYSNGVWVNLANGSLYQGVNSQQLVITDPTLNGLPYRLTGSGTGGTFDLTPITLTFDSQQIYYVDGTRGYAYYTNYEAVHSSAPVYNGNSWATAYPTLHEALAVAQPGSEIWVRAGTYYPLRTFGEDNVPLPARLSLAPGVRLLGGFNGTETNDAQRNWTTNLTIINCALNAPGDDPSLTEYQYAASPSIFVNGTNIANDSVLDGFQLTGATAGAIVNLGGSPTIENCVLGGNTSAQGAAIGSWSNASPVILNCVISTNVAQQGTLYFNNATGLVENCVLSFNTVLLGSVIDSANSAVSLLNSTVAFNTGVGIQSLDGNASVVNSILWDNTVAEVGGSVAYLAYSCVQDGGTTNNNLAVDPIFDLPASNNLQLAASSPLLAQGSTAAASGLSTDLNGNPRTVNGHTDLGAYEYQGTAATTVSAVSLPYSLSVTNLSTNSLVAAGLPASFTSIQWEVSTNGANGVFAPVASTALVNYSTSLAGNTATLTLYLTNTLDAFAYDALNGALYRFIEPGLNFTSPPALLTVQLPEVRYVNINSTASSPDGTTWANAFTTLSQALTVAATNADVNAIWIAQGTYALPPSSATLKAQLYGGFAGGETVLTQRNWSNNVTTLTATGCAVSGGLDGFTIAGSTNLQNGITINFASPTIENCVFTGGNTQLTVNGGLPVLGNCVFSNATTGLLISAGIVSITNDIFTSLSNAVTATGNAADAAISHSIFTGNTGAGVQDQAGAAVTVWDSLFTGNTGDAIIHYGSQGGTLTVINSTLTGNTQPDGAITAPGPTDAAGLQVENSILWNNTSTNWSSYILNNPAVFTPSVAWAYSNADLNEIETYSGSAYVIATAEALAAQNAGQGSLAATAESQAAEFLAQSTNLLAGVSYDCIQGLTFFSGNSNIDEDPFFVDPTAGDYQLGTWSPAQDAGNSSLVPAGETDLAGNPRIFGPAVDLGAYETQSASVGVVGFVVNPEPLAISVPGTASFTAVVAPNSSLTNYAWQINSGSGWTTVTTGGLLTISNNVSANATTLTVNPLDLTLNGTQFRVTALSATNTSTVATLTVLPGPLAATVGQTATTTAVLPVGTDASTYVWQYNSGSGWINVTNGTTYVITYSGNTSTLTLLEAVPGLNGQYRFVAGNGSFASAAVTLATYVPPVLYVNATATGNNTGTNWANALTNLSTALAGVQPGEQIWVTAGTYAATNSAGASITWPLNEGAAIYGGFAGTETSRAQRTFANPTILVAGTNATLLTAAPNVSGAQVILEGFTVVGGNGQSAIADTTAMATIQDCVFSNNLAGVAAFTNATVTFSNCLFTANSATNGGAITFTGGAGSLWWCQFLTNSAQLEGGAIFAQSTTLQGTNCIFNGNAAGDNGGAINLQGYGAAINLALSSLTGNTGNNGGAIYYYEGDLDAPGSYLYDDLIVDNNSRGQGGGVYWNEPDSAGLWIVCSTVANNTAAGQGGGIFCTPQVDDFFGSARLNNSIFWGNQDQAGDSVELQQIYDGGVLNSIAVALQDAENGFIGYNFTLYLYYDNNIIEGLALYNQEFGDDYHLTGNSVNLGADPQFVNASAGNYQLQPTSPAINVGDNQYTAVSDIGFSPGFYNVYYDLAGNPRIYNGTVDLGAYEVQTNQAPPFQSAVLPVSQTLCDDGSAATFTLGTAGPLNLTNVYWLVNTGSGFTGVAGSSYAVTTTATNTSLTVSPATLAMSGYQYEVAVNGYAYATPPITLTVNPETVVYVNAAATGTNSGTDWADAYTNLQAALNGTSCSQIWVAQGTYTIPTGTNGAISFSLHQFLDLRGGFNGTETSVNQRDYVRNPTILAATNGQSIFFNDGDSGPVDHTAILDGFILTGATVNPAINNLDAAPIIRNCVFTNNLVRAIADQGVTNSASALITNCLFADNSGGGIRVNSSGPTITGCSFVSNNVAGYGSGIDNEQGAPTVVNCAFLDNTANTGGGFYNNTTNPGTLLARDTFIGNSAIEQGGALDNTAGSVLTVRDSLLAENSALLYGGAIFDSGTLTAVNDTIVDNFAIYYAGAAWVDSGASFNVFNSILWDNSVNALDSSGVAVQVTGGAPTAALAGISNSIVEAWPTADANDNLTSNPQFIDESAGDYLLAGSSPAVDIGSTNVILAGELDLADNAREQRSSVDLGAYEYLGSPTTASDISLLPHSATVCASNNVSFTVAAPAVDGYTYVWQQESSGGNFTNLNASATDSITSTNGVGTLEISDVSTALSGSAYRVLVEGGSETVTSAVFTLTVTPRSIIYVNSQAAPGGNGSSWGNAFVNLADAVSQGNCADIWIAGGVYTPTNDTSGQPVTLQLAEGVRLFGGFAGTETNLAQRNVAANPTILVAPAAAPALEALGSSTPINQSTLVDSLTITGGSTVPAVLFSDASPLLQNCVFTTNSAAAVLCQGNAAAAFVNCAFSNNIGASAVQVQGAAPTFTGCVFAGNQGQSGGAIAATADASFTVQQGVFTNNTAAVAGGAISVDASTAAVSDSLFAGNAADNGGALSDTDGAALTLINDTIADNSAASVGGVAVSGQGSQGAITNCILWNNGGSESAQLSGNLAVAYSDIEDLSQFAGNANISGNPVFVNEASGIYTLQTGSSAIDLGDDAAADSSVDLAGNARIQGYAVDLGAYESSYTAAFAEIVRQPGATTGCLDGAVEITAAGPANAPANFGGNLIWQVNSGSGFTNLPLTGIYSVITTANSSMLVISNAILNLTGLQFRVALGEISGLYSSAATLTVLPHRILYVNAAATGNHNGADWADAYTSLDAALADGDQCTEIWVAQGNYTSANPAGGPGFNLINATAVYGGFAGTETNLAQRNWSANLTVLTGSGQTNVVQMATGGTLDGFILIGNSNMNGVYIAPGEAATVQNCLFPGLPGSAVVNANTGGTLLQSCTLTNGSQVAVINEPGSTLTVSNCMLNNNMGGAIQNQDGLLTVDYSSFTGNLAANGSAIYATGNDSPVVQVNYCIFATNTVSGEGTLWSGASNTLTVVNSLFYNNTAATDGAGVTSYGQLTVRSSTFAYNNAGGGTAGIACPTGTAAITNSILWGDTVGATPAELSGAVTTWYDIIENGANPAANDLGYDPVFTDPATGNFTLPEYSPAVSAGYAPGTAGIAKDLAGNARVGSWGLDVGAYQSSLGPYGAVPEILADPISTSVCVSQPSVTLSFTVSDNQPYYWLVNAGGGWFALNLGNEQESGSLSTSPYTAATTYNGNVVTHTITISQLSFNLSGYQFAVADATGYFVDSPATLSIVSQGTLYVNAAAAPGGNGQSWATAFNDLPSALNSASVCENNIWVAAGTYSCSNSPDGTFQIPWLTNGVHIYGGFNGTETDVSQRNWTNNPTILTGPTNGSPVVSFDGASGWITNTTTLDGFIVSGGSEGIVINQASPVIASSIVESNDNGGLIIVSNSYPTLVYDQILANTGPDGGGVTLLGSSLNLQECTLQGNSGGYAGAVFASGNSWLSFQDGLVTGNAGVALVLSNSQSAFDNVTIAGNSNGIASFGALAQIDNCILWGNGDTGAQSDQLTGSVAPDYCCIEGLNSYYSGDNTIGYNPLFVAPFTADQAPVTGGNYHLYASSPAIAAGFYVFDVSVGSIINVDLDGNPRVLNNTVDLGAYEFQGTPVQPLIVNSAITSTATTYNGPNTTNMISVTVQSGDIASYQWQINTGSGWVNLTEGEYNAFFGTTTATLSIVNPPVSLNGAQYRVIVTDVAGATQITTPGTLTVVNLTLYVSPTGSNTGGYSWATAYTNLQTALVNVNGASGQQVWVAAGAYYADLTNTNALFQLPGNVAVLGGFNGTETSASQRNWTTNVTVLEGVLPGGGNSATLLSVQNVGGVSVDGFTLRDAGTAITSGNSGLTVSNCFFTGNTQAVNATYGSLLLADCVVSNNTGNAVQHSQTAASVVNCVFVNNPGTALYNGEETQGGSINVQGTLFTGNGIGALTAPQSVPVFAGCTFAGNGQGLLMENSGGVNSLQAQALIDHCEFFTNNNSAIQGNNAWILISRCQFRGNSSPIYGGAVAIYNGVVQAVDSLFSGNYAAQGGGAICQTAGGSLTLNNCTIVDNGANGPGGGVLSSEPYNYTSISNCILWNNYGPDTGGTLGESTYAQLYDGNYDTYSFPGANNEIQNSPYSTTQADPAFVQPIYGGGSNAPTVAGDFHLGGDSALIGAGNPADVFESGGFWQNASWMAANPITTDLNGNPRLNNGTVDLGAYEYQGTAPTTPLAITGDPADTTYYTAPGSGPYDFTASATGTGLTYQWYANYGQGFVALTDGGVFSGVNTATLQLSTLPASLNGVQFLVEITSSAGGSIYTTPATLGIIQNQWYVNAAAPAGGNGASWATAFNTLSAALANTNLIANASVANQAIWVAAGSYYADPANTNATFLLTNNVTVLGGFNGTETNGSERNWNTNVTVLEGALPGGGNNVTLLSAQNATNVTVDGFTLQDAVTAVASTNAGLTLSDCVFTSNGQAVGAEYGNLTLASCVISNNSASYAVAQSVIAATITNCVFAHNPGTALYDGTESPSGSAGVWNTLFVNNGVGAYAALNTVPTFENCTFAGNSNGLVTANDSNDGLVDNCGFFTNYDSAFVADDGYMILSRCQFRGNSTPGYGGAVAVYSGSVEIVNSLLSGNYAAQGGGAIYQAANGIVALNDCTVADNGASGPGAGILDSAPGSYIFNCILWGNYGPDANGNPGESAEAQFYNNAYGSHQFNGGPDDVQNDPDASNPANNLTAADPGFVQALFGGGINAPTVAGDFRLGGDSILMGLGDLANLYQAIAPDGSPITTDLAGNPRLNPNNGSLDLGAYQFQGTPPSSPLGVTASPTGLIYYPNDPSHDAITAVVTGTGLTYQWYGNFGQGFVALTNGAYFSGVTTARLSLSSLAASLNDTQFMLEVTSSLGGSIFTAPTTLTTVIPSQWYVNPTAAADGDGASWATAFTNLQTALANLPPHATNQVIWVAAGTYYADPANTNATFPLATNMILLGGFNGTETSASQRNWNTNPTVLEGALPGGGNSATLLSLQNLPGVIVDGFTLQGAVTAIASTNAGLTLSNCLLTGNSQAIGAEGGTLALVSCVVSNNSASYAVAHSESAVGITNCTFANNPGTALYNGDEHQGGSLGVQNTLFTDNGVGAYAATDSVPVFEGCTFAGNTRGLELYNHSSFESVSAGGLVYAYAEVDYCQFITNSDGAILASSADVFISRSAFQGNHTFSTGGALAINSGYVQAVDSLFSGNFAYQGGGAISQMGGGQLTLNNCTIAANGARRLGGGILSGSSYNDTSISNCIFWGNYGPDDSGTLGESVYAQFYDTNYGSYQFNGAQNDVENDPDAGHSAYVSTAANPAFVQPVFGGGANAPTNAGDFHLGSDSPLINAGAPADVYETGGFWQNAGWAAANPITTDLDGNPRLTNDLVDLGAYELGGTPTAPLAVAANPTNLVYSATTTGSDTFTATVSGTGLTYQWYVNLNDGQGFVALSDNAYFSGSGTATLNLSSLLSTAYNGAQFLLEVTSSDGGVVDTAPATLTVNPNIWYVNSAAPAGGDGSSWATAYNNLNLALANTNLPVVSNPQIWVAGSSFTANGGNWTIPAGVTVAGGFAGTETNASQRQLDTHATVLSNPVIVDDSATLDGFTLNETNAATTVISYPDTVTNAPCIANCIVKVPAGGTGIASTAEYTGNDLTVTNCQIIGGNYGVNVSSPLYLYDCTVSNYQYAGVSFYHETNLTNIFERCVFFGTGAASTGLYEGAYNTSNAPDILDHCTVVDNQYGFVGDGYTMNLCVTNCTISANSQGGIYATAPSFATVNIDHTIMTSNSPAIYSSGSIAYLTVNESLLAGNYGTTNAGAITDPTRYQGYGYTIIISDSTIAGNYSAQDVGAIDAGGDNLTLNNSIIWNNGDNGAGIIAASSVNGGNNCVQSFDGHFGNTNSNLSVDPQFVNAVAPSLAPTSAGNYQLTTNSPLRTLGNPALTTDTTDLAGNPRLAGGEIDPGAYQTGITYSFSPMQPFSPTTGFQFNITGTLSSYSVQWSTDLINWSNIGSFTSLGNGNFQFTDPNATTRPQGYYRVTSP